MLIYFQKRVSSAEYLKFERVVMWKKGGPCASSLLLKLRVDDFLVLNIFPLVFELLKLLQSLKIHS